MNKEQWGFWRKLAICLTIVIGILGVLFTIGYVARSQEADEACYTDLQALASWDEARPIAANAVKDRYITKGECFDMRHAYDRAQKRRQLENLQLKREEAFRAYDQQEKDSH